jgi:hypothetical protein
VLRAAALVSFYLFTLITPCRPYDNELAPGETLYHEAVLSRILRPLYLALTVYTVDRLNYFPQLLVATQRP